MLGDGIVSLGTEVVAAASRMNAKSSPKIVSEMPSLLLMCSAAGVNSISPSSFMNLIAMWPASWVIPSSW